MFLFKIKSVSLEQNFRVFIEQDLTSCYRHFCLSIEHFERDKFRCLQIIYRIKHVTIFILTSKTMTQQIAVAF